MQLISPVFVWKLRATPRARRERYEGEGQTAVSVCRKLPERTFSVQIERAQSVHRA